MTPTKATASLEDAIRQQVDEFVNAWNKHDARAMAQVYTDDADLISPQGRIAKNKKEIETLFRDEHSNAFRDSHMKLRPAGVRLLSSDVALGEYEFEVTGAKDLSGNSTTMRGHITDVFKKQGNAWMVAASRPMIPVTNPGQRN